MNPLFIRNILGIPSYTISHYKHPQSVTFSRIYANLFHAHVFICLISKCHVKIVILFDQAFHLNL